MLFLPFLLVKFPKFCLLFYIFPHWISPKFWNLKISPKVTSPKNAENPFPLKTKFPKKKNHCPLGTFFFSYIKYRNNKTWTVILPTKLEEPQMVVPTPEFAYYIFGISLGKSRSWIVSPPCNFMNNLILLPFFFP